MRVRWVPARTSVTTQAISRSPSPVAVRMESVSTLMTLTLVVSEDVLDRIMVKLCSTITVFRAPCLPGAKLFSYDPFALGYICLYFVYHEARSKLKKPITISNGKQAAI